MTVNLSDLRILVGLQLGRSRIDESARFVEELGAESADILNIILAVEDKHNIHIDDGEMYEIRSTTDLYNLVRSRKGES